MSDRTDLFKALNHFIATLAAYAPGSHRDDVVLEVGDTAFRALSAAMDAAPHMAAKFMGDKFVLKTQSGRVVIRKRQPSLADLAAAEDKAMDDLKTYSARQSREAQLEREKADAKEPKTRAAPIPAWVTPLVSPCCERDTDGDGNCDQHKTVISASTPAVPVCGFRSPEGLSCMKYDGHAFEHVVGDAPSSVCGLPRGHIEMGPATQAELERERFAAKDRKRMEPPVCFGCGSSEGTLFNTQETPQSAPLGRIYVHMWDSCRRAMSDKVHALVGAEPSGINSVVRGKPGAYRDSDGAFRPPEETKPPARAHLKGCVLDTDHKEGCVVPLWFTDAEPFMFKGAAPSALSPRQALGEALACVERARDLFLGVAADPTVDKDVRLAALNGYQSAMNAWGSTTTARALLAKSEPKP